MDYDQLTKEIINYQKKVFSIWYDTMVVIQDQATSVMEQTLQENAWLLPEEGRKTIQDWIVTFRQECGQLKANVDEGFADLEKYMSEGKKATQSSAKKQAPSRKKAAQSSEKKQAPSRKKAAQSSEKKQAPSRKKAAKRTAKKQAPTS